MCLKPTKAFPVLTDPAIKSSGSERTFCSWSLTYHVLNEIKRQQILQKIGTLPHQYTAPQPQKTI